MEFFWGKKTSLFSQTTFLLEAKRRVFRALKSAALRHGCESFVFQMLVEAFKIIEMLSCSKQSPKLLFPISSHPEQHSEMLSQKINQTVKTEIRKKRRQLSETLLLEMYVVYKNINLIRVYFSVFIATIESD